MPDFTELSEILAPARSGLRERVLKQTLERRRLQLKMALQADAPASLSPLEVELNRQHASAVKADLDRLSDSISAIRQQNAAEEQARANLRKLSPLERSRNRQGLFRRSGDDRNAAILGALLS